MRRTVVGFAVTALLVVGILAWQRCGAGSEAGAGAGAGSAAAAGSADPLAARRAAHAHAADAPTTPGSLAGTVTRKSDGAPVPGAVVALADAAGIDMGETPDGGATTVVIADAHGAWIATPLGAGAYAVSATAPGYAAATLTGVVLASGEHRAGIALVVDAGAPNLTGVVSDVGGGGIAGARVTATRSGRESVAPAPALVAIAGADGRYALTLADGDYHVTASHDDYTHQRKRVTLAGAPRQLDFALVPGATIRGQVVTRGDGKPLAGAVVIASSGARGAARGETTAICDDTGAFTLRGIHAGSLSLIARAHGFASATPTTVDVGIGESVDGVRIVVDRAFTISGYVVHKGKPADGIAGVRVAVFSIAAQQELQSRAPSGSDGYFEIVGVRPASYLIAAYGEDVMPEMGKGIEVVDRDVGDVLVEMASGVTIEGRVEPPLVASLAIEPKSIGLGNMFDVAKASMVHGDSDASGGFVLHHVPTGAFTLVATTADGHIGKLPIAIADVDQTGLVVQLEAQAALVGRVVDGNHAPVGGLHVAADPVVAPTEGAITFAMPRSGGATTADDGSFRIVGLPAGKVHVSVADDRGALAWIGRDKPSEPIALDIVAARDNQAGTLVVEATTGVIHGVVIGADGQPAADAWVTATLDDSALEPMARMRAAMLAMSSDEQPPALSGADGKFTIEHLRQGTYNLVAEGPRGTSRGDKKGVKAGDTVTVTLASLGTLSGHVSAGGAPVATFDLECKGVVTANRHVTAADGAYVLERLAPGPYACDVSADAGTAVGSADVPAGAATLDLLLVPYASVTGVVVSVLGGAPLPGLKIFAQGAGNQMNGIAAMLTGGSPTTDASGRFVVDKLGAGSGSLVVLPPSGDFTANLATRPLALVAGQRLDLGVIKVVPPRTGDAGTLGMGTSVDGSALVVASVAPGGPAATAGIAVGDKIVSIDGTAIADIGVELAKTALGAGTIGVGTTFALALDRAGSPVSASVTAAKW